MAVKTTPKHVEEILGQMVNQVNTPTNKIADDAGAWSDKLQASFIYARFLQCVQLT